MHTFFNYTIGTLSSYLKSDVATLENVLFIIFRSSYPSGIKRYSKSDKFLIFDVS